MTNTETIKAALIKQIIDSGSTLPLSVLVGNIDLLINAAKAEKESAIIDKVFGSHITEPELKVEDLKAGEWCWYIDKYGYDWIIKFKEIKDGKLFVYKCHKIYDGYNVNIETVIAWKPFAKSIRHATREEIIKYFPHEFEIDSHGGNDIPQLTDPHI
jgi:hypothetical protein